MTLPQPLAGVKVIDCTQIMAGPFCTMLLGDMGADVIKIEKPDGGDDVRRSGPPFLNGESAAFLGINRNKRSAVIDLKSEEGVAIVRRMAESADILVQNMRPGTMEKMGLGYESLRKVNPALVYSTISGYGITGPYRDKAGFDLVAQGMSGIMSVTGFPGGAPAKAGVPITDLNAGLFGAYGIMCAYVNRLKTGHGQHVDTSLLEAGIAYTIWESSIYFASGRSPGPNGSAHQLSAPYQAFPTSDGYVNVGGANQSNWLRICQATGREDLLADPRFATNADRITNRAPLIATLSATFVTGPTSHWLEALERAGVPCGPIYDMASVYADPQVQAREMVVEQEHPKSGRLRHIGIPVKLSDTPGAIRLPPPLLGQQTDEVLREFGYAEAQIGDLRGRGVVR
ncbi:MAG: CoA transferase [SAR202 cluster bacterium]|nr:CoA transferase [SAR202 cluster bacterium]